jgi:hypothetical protein
VEQWIKFNISRIRSCKIDMKALPPILRKENTSELNHHPLHTILHKTPTIGA